ncbi:methyltransferase family protein [Mesorhizobium sp. ANAO-SY3R2]|uniref:methyltransferase family protein n=1 Tax=Mesorhizobium sp. ANAO-SY3R2 TaxID=3166644 RepID=UPI003671B743
MNSRLEDLLGKSLMIAIFLYLAIMQANTIVVVVQLRDQLDLWPFVLASRVSGLAFLTLVVFLTVIRRAPKNVSAGIQPRVTAIAGTFCLMFLAVVPTGNPGSGLQVAAASLMTLGTILSIWCAIYLGRSFSIMAVARHLVVQGPYALVRHPLYAAEAVASLGAALHGWSIWAALLFIAWCGFQYRRMLNEEAILRTTFPEYEDYARRVPRIVPGLTRYRPGNAAA